MSARFFVDDVGEVAADDVTMGVAGVVRLDDTTGVDGVDNIVDGVARLAFVCVDGVAGFAFVCVVRDVLASGDARLAFVGVARDLASGVDGVDVDDGVVCFAFVCVVRGDLASCT